MRELSTDRPDKTESPYTVDAGHFQLEADIATYTYDRYKKRGEDLRTRGWSAGILNLKAGLTNRSDLQFVVESYASQTVTDRVAGTQERANGFGDITVRYKYNLWGNDSGDSALGLLPFVKLPTNSDDLGNDDVEGGMAMPYALDLGNGYGLGLMPQIVIVKDEDDQGYSPSFLTTATLGVDLTEDAGAYFELAAERNTDVREWNVTFDTGVTYAFTPDVQFDAGINIGLTEAAADYNPFIGITYRY